MDIRRIQFTIAIALLGVAPLFFVGGPDWSDGPLYRALWNLGHIVFFGLATGWIVLRREVSFRLWLWVTIAVVVVGGMVELVQGQMNRQPHWQDMWRNLIGAWLVLAWASRPALLGKRRVWGLRAATMLFLVLEIGVIAVVGLRQWEISQLPPRLYDFNAEDIDTYWSGSIERSATQQGEMDNSLRLSLTPGTYSGATLHNLPADWTGYQTLRLGFHLQGDSPLHLTLRVHDVRHEQGNMAYEDRFNQRLLLQPGTNTFELPLASIQSAPESRSMNMDGIRRLGLFAVSLPAPRTVYLTELELR